MESPCDVVAWDALARFITYGGGGCKLNSYHPLVSMGNTRTDKDGELEERIVVSVDTSKRIHVDVTYGMVYRPSHYGDRYRDVPYGQVRFMDHAAPMSPTVRMPKLLNVSGEHVLPPSARQARNLPASNK